MLSKYYRGQIKYFSKTMGLHPTISTLYHRTRPSEYLDRYDRASLKENCAMRYSFNHPEQIKIECPKFVPNQEAPSEFEKICGTHNLEQPFVAEIHNATVLKHSGICTTAEGTLLLETINSREEKILTCFKGRQFEAAKLLLEQKYHKQNKKTKKSKPDIEIAISLIEAPYRPQRSYYSTKWIQSYLTKLQGIFYFINKTGIKPKILVEIDPQPYKISSLQLLGFDRDDIVQWNPDQKLHIKRLLVPSIRKIEKNNQYDKKIRGVIYKLLSPNACKWLRKEIRERISRKGSYSNKVFISREDAEKRNIINRNKVVNLLHRHGYEQYILSELSFEQQAELFAQADKIVAPHGAGLTNIMFAKDCEIIEIFGSKIKPTFYLQSQVLNLEYTALLQKAVGDNIHVDTDVLSTII